MRFFRSKSVRIQFFSTKKNKKDLKKKIALVITIRLIISWILSLPIHVLLCTTSNQRWKANPAQSINTFNVERANAYLVISRYLRQRDQFSRSNQRCWWQRIRNLLTHVVVVFVVDGRYFAAEDEIPICAPIALSID